VPNSFIYARVFIKDGWVNKDTGKKSDPRVQYNSMQMLQDVMDSQARKLTIQMPVEALAEDKINTLKDLFKMHKGDKQLHFVIYELEDKIKLSMSSRKHKVNISQELLDELTREQVSYRLN
jgi:DNA polymerase-3 subunit alpha